MVFPKDIKWVWLLISVSLCVFSTFPLTYLFFLFLLPLKMQVSFSRHCSALEAFGSLSCIYHSVAKKLERHPSSVLLKVLSAFQTYKPCPWAQLPLFSHPELDFLGNDLSWTFELRQMQCITYFKRGSSVVGQCMKKSSMCYCSHGRLGQKWKQNKSSLFWLFLGSADEALGLPSFKVCVCEELSGWHEACIQNGALD